jgi:hypothetical protein
MSRRIQTLLLLAALFAALTIGIHTITRNNPLGADFYTFWVAGRAALQGQNPYSAEVTLQSQLGILGRPAQQGEDQLAFAYPPYSLFAILPVLWLPFDWAQAAWLSCLLLALLIIWRISFRNAPTWLPASFIFFYPVAFGLLLGNFAIILSLIFLGFYRFCVEKTPSVRLQVLYGILLAWTTIKPQFSWAFLLFTLLIILRRQLWPLLASLLGSSLLWTGLGWLLAPNWPVLWVKRLSEYAAYVQSQPVLTLALDFLPSTTKTALLIISAAISLIVSFWLGRAFFLNQRPALQLFAWAGLITFLFHLHGMAYEQIVFLLPFGIWAASTQQTRSRHIWWGLLWLGSWVTFAFGLFYPPADVWLIFIYLGWLLWLFRLH